MSDFPTPHPADPGEDDFETLDGCQEAARTAVGVTDLTWDDPQPIGPHGSLRWTARLLGDRYVHIDKALGYIR